MRAAATKVCAGCGGVALGKATAKVLEFVIGFRVLHGCFPTYRDIRVGLAYETNQNVRYHLVVLRDLGLMTLDGNVITEARRKA